MDKKLRAVFRRSLAYSLRDMGNPILEASSNMANPLKTVYYFEDTEKLRSDITLLSKKK